MKKNYIKPEMEMWKADVQPLCLSRDDENAADPNMPGLVKQNTYLFDDSDEPAIED